MFSQQVLELQIHIKREFSRMFLLSFSKGFFLNFLLSNLSSFLTQAWAFHCYTHLTGSLYVRVFVCDQAFYVRVFVCYIHPPGFFEFFTFTSILVFLIQAWAIHCYIHPPGFLYVRVFVCDQEVITKYSILYWEGGRSCGLGELAGSHCVLFLRKQVRDLRVQEFLRELVVGVAAPSDLTG